MNRERFSRDFVLRGLMDRERRLRDSNKFTDRTGYAQVTGKGEEKNRAYGEWNMLCMLIEEYSR